MAALAVVALVLGGVAMSSCTTFDGLSLPSSDASTRFEAADNSEAGADAEVPPGYLSLDDAARLCALVFECPELSSSVQYSVAVPVDPSNYSRCVHWLAAPMPSDRAGLAVQAQTFACMLQGATCSTASACLWVEAVAAGDPRCAGAGQTCGEDGGVVYDCPDYIYHCGAPYFRSGSTCQIGLSGGGYCGLGTNCNVQRSCIGTLLDFCIDNVHMGINCASDGYTCDVASNDDSGAPNCNTGTLELPCTAPGASCAGAVDDVCDGNDVSEFDCAALGQTCLSQAGPAICGTSTDACTPFDPGINVCTGSNLSLCVGGHPQTVDCSTLELDGRTLSCIPAAGSESGHCG